MVRSPTVDGGPPVGQVEPARGAVGVLELLPGQLGGVGVALSRRRAGGTSAGCAASGRSSRWSRARRRRVRRAAGPSESSTGGSASRWARLSPVLTTRSGSRSASDRTHSCLRDWLGVMWMSLRCRTRSGRAPAGSTGIVAQRSVKARDSHTAYAVRPAPAATPAPRERMQKAGGGHGARLPQCCTRHERSQGPAAQRPHHRDQGARRAALLDDPDGAVGHHQRRGGRQAGARAERRRHRRGALDRGQEAA